MTSICRVVLYLLCGLGGFPSVKIVQSQLPLIIPMLRLQDRLDNVAAAAAAAAVLCVLHLVK